MPVTATGSFREDSDDRQGDWLEAGRGRGWGERPELKRGWLPGYTLGGYFPGEEGAGGRSGWSRFPITMAKSETVV